MIFVGVDPGKEGAIAWLDGERKHIEIHDQPLTKDGDYDLFGMYRLLQEACWNGAAETVVTIEKVHAMPGDGKCSDFTFGGGWYSWRMACASLRLEPQLVDPRAWKRTMLAGIANDKQAEALALEWRFQGHKLDLRGPRGGLRDGRVDAIFLAEYGRLTWRVSGQTCRSGR